MDFLNYRGLKYYHELLKEKLKNLKAEAIKESTYFPGDNITIADHVISAVIPQYEAGDNIVIEDGVITAVIPKEHDFTYTASSAKSRSDNLLYFTTDTHEIYRNGISYGGSINSESITTLPTETFANKLLKDTVSNTKFYPVTHVNAVVGINKYSEKQPAFIDLGLSVKWATCNVGANKPEEYGDYFAWGEVEPKKVYSWSTYKLCNGSSSSLTKYTSSDGKTKLESVDDVVIYKYGSDLYLPSPNDWDELKTKCTWTWTTQYGKYGYKVTGPNGNSIFLPAAGYKYDSSTSTASYGYYWMNEVWATKHNGQAFAFYSSSRYNTGSPRHYGYSVRAVCPNEKTYDSTKTQAQATAASTDNVVYYTTDTKQIYLNGTSYGGSITVNTSNKTASDEVGIRELKDVVTNEKFYPQTHVDAISGIDVYAEKTYVEETFNLVLNKIGRVPEDDITNMVLNTTSLEEAYLEPFDTEVAQQLNNIIE